jgi:hypothetical protein
MFYIPYTFPVSITVSEFIKWNKVNVPVCVYVCEHSWMCILNIHKDYESPLSIVNENST